MLNFLPTSQVSETELMSAWLSEKKRLTPFWNESQWRELSQKDEYSLALKKEKEGQILAGALFYLLNHSGTAHLLKIWVESSVEGKGLGRELLDFCEQQLLGQKFSFLFLEVRQSNRRAVKFYQKAGYKNLGLRRSLYSDGESGFAMHKKL